MELNDENLTLVLQGFRAKLIAEGSPDQLATYFENHGVQAFCGAPAHCAISVALKDAIEAEFGAADIIYTSVASGLRATVSQDGEKARAYIGSGPELIEFMNLFDRGYYPALMHQDDTTGHYRSGCLRVAFGATGLPVEEFADWLRSDEAFAVMQSL